MKPNTKKTLLATVLGLSLNVITPAAHASLVLTFTDSTATAAKPGACSNIAWTAGGEFRMCDPSGVLAGGLPHHKDAIFGGETYTFNDMSVMTGVTGTPGNVGGTYMGESFPGSAAPLAGSNPTWQQDAIFYGVTFSILAPVQDSLAGTAYGSATYLGGTPVNGSLMPFIHAPVLEMQWGGTWFPLGLSHAFGDKGLDAGLGVTFYADITNVVTSGSTTTFDFHMYANEKLDIAEDPGAACCSGWTAQWHQQGSGLYTAPVPLPAAVWLFGSGLLGLAGFTRRRIAV